MSKKPNPPPVQFKTRMPSVPPAPRPPGPPAKRSGHVALFLMGTLAVGGTAYTLMPSNRCEQQPSALQSQLPDNTNCPPRSSSGSSGGGGSSSRSSYYSGSDSSSSHSSSSTSSSGTSSPGSSSVARGGFGSFGHAVGFSGG